MGSPQPPPRHAAASDIASLPFDVQYALLSSLDSFSTLTSLTTALPSFASVAAKFPVGLTATIAETEFAPLADALLAVKVLDADEGARQAVVVEHFDPEVSGDDGKLDNETRNKLHILNTAAEELAGQFLARRGIAEESMKNRELHRFKRAMWRAIVLFELYKESKTLSSDEDESESEESDLASNNNNTGALTPSRAFLSRFPHQHILELDCVREFLSELATDLADSARDASESPCSNTTANIPRTFGITLPTPPTPTPGEPQPTCACTAPADREPDTPAPSISACSVCSEHLPENLLLLGPVTLVALQKLPTHQLPKVVGSLAPLGKRDLFWDETMKFWAGVKGVYEGEGKRRELPRGCKRIEDVMSVRGYEKAVMDCGQIF